MIPETIDVEDAHEDDQARAAAHNAIDNSEAYVVVAIDRKTCDIHRVSSASDPAAIKLIGALSYQIHVMKLRLDARGADDPDEPGEPEA